MIAYYVHDKKDLTDVVVIPELGCSVAVDADRLLSFISVSPKFETWSGDACGVMTPEDYGTIVATRDDCGDVNVIHEVLWRERMNLHLATGR